MLKIVKKCNSETSAKFLSSVRFLSLNRLKQDDQNQCDIAIVGGGIMGLSSAFWLKTRKPHLKIKIIEMEPEYQSCSTVRSAGGIRQQFSRPENILLSKFSFDFLSKIDENLKLEDKVDINLRHGGYLFVASSKGIQILMENHRIQREYGANVEILTKSQIAERYPYLNIDDIELASFGLSNEGSFDPYSLLMAFKAKIKQQQIPLIKGEVIEFGSSQGKFDEIVYRDPQRNLESVKFSQMIITSGCRTGEISKKLGIGDENSQYPQVCPVVPRKRYVYTFKCAEELKSFPMLIDYSGIYCRFEGSHFITGKSPNEEEEPPCSISDRSDVDKIDYQFFDDEIWPHLANRVPLFNNIKLLNAWGGYYDFNELDGNAIIGQHPKFGHIFWLAGFSGHGIQMAVGAGHALAELIIDGKFKTIDLTRFTWQRVLDNKPYEERNII